MDDWPTCSHCGGGMDWEDCTEIGCDDGWITDLHELDPLWYDEDEIERCPMCRGKGGWWVCPNCQREG